VCLNDAGKTEFRDLFFRRGEPRFLAFDLLWCDGQDLRYAPLTERKHRLRWILPANSERVLYCDHVERAMEIACSVLRATTISRASLQSGSLIPIWTTRQVGSRSAMRTIHNGLDAKSCSNASATPILTCHCGTIV
jgi:hypothetical protein